MKKSFSRSILFIIIFTFLVSSIYGQSFYNSRGFGERIYFTNAQSIGMGGVITALPDAHQINMLNPAALVFIPISRLNGDFIHQSLWSQSEGGNGFSKYTNLNGISLALPLKLNRLVTAFGIAPSTQFDYNFETADKINDYNYTKIIKATGGLNKISFGFGLSPIKRIAIGAYFNYHFGQMDKTWKIDYVSDLYWDTINELKRKMWGYNFSGGIMVNPFSTIQIGGFYSSSYNLNYYDQLKNSTQKGSLTNIIDETKSEDMKMNPPELWGLGISYTAKSKYRFALDYSVEPWSKFELDESDGYAFNDRERYGLGFELLPSTNMLASYYEKMTYRLGYFYQKLDFINEENQSVSEYGLSLGLGFPYYNNFGRLDLALRFGKRGDLSENSVSEDLFQIFISITGGERWFVRRGQK